MKALKHLSAEDLSRLTWESIQGEVADMQRAVMDAWQEFGPCTTRELSRRSGIDICTVRPRTTELLQAGLVHLDGDSGRQGVYRLASQAEFDAARQSYAESPRMEG